MSTHNQIVSRLTAILSDMDVPTKRQDVTESGNVRWLLRNLAIRNGDHPDFDEAISHILTLTWEPVLPLEK